MARTQEYLQRIIALENGAQTTSAKARAEKARQYLENTDDDGRFGRIEELLSASDFSRKARVSKQGQADNFIKWRNDSGKIVNRPAECKTNGGRIQDLITRLEKGKDTLLIYSLNINNKNTGNKTRTVEPILCYFSLFYEMLQDINGLKSTNGKNPEMAIQATSKKLYERLLDYPIPYDPQEVYQESDFEDLEL